MPWQENIETGRATKLAIADENTAAPSRPNTGTAIDLSGDADWTENPYEFTDSDFAINLVSDEGVAVHPPLKPNKVALFRDNVGVDSIQVTSYEVGEKVLNWATNITEDAGKFTEDASFSRKALLLEIQGLGFYYFPSVEIKAEGITAGPRTVASQMLTFTVFGTTSIPSGYEYYHYQDAS